VRRRVLLNRTLNQTGEIYRMSHLHTCPACFGFTLGQRYVSLMPRRSRNFSGDSASRIASTSGATRNALVIQNLHLDLFAWLPNSGLCC
jgi:hypothetical protein